MKIKVSKDINEYHLEDAETGKPQFTVHDLNEYQKKIVSTIQNLISTVFIRLFGLKRGTENIL